MLAGAVTDAETLYVDAELSASIAKTPEEPSAASIFVGKTLALIATVLRAMISPIPEVT